MSYLFMRDMPWCLCVCVKRRWSGPQWRQLSPSEAAGQIFPVCLCLVVVAVAFRPPPRPVRRRDRWWFRGSFGVVAWQRRASSAVITIGGHGRSTTSWQLKTTADIRAELLKGTARALMQLPTHSLLMMKVPERIDILWQQTALWTI